VMNPSDILQIKNITKPIERLLEILRGAVWAIYEPAHIVRIANAAAQAQIIQAETRETVRDIELRGEIRRLRVQERRQRNIENIAKQAVEFLSEEVPEEKPIEDWVFRFFDSCQDVGDRDIQRIWSRILAGEINKPGSSSYRTLEILKTLRRQDADLFTKLGSFVWKTPYGYEVYLSDAIRSYQQEIGLSERRVHLLKFLGLINPDPTLSYTATDKMAIYGEYFGRELKIWGNPSFTVYCMLLSESGEELFPICGATPDQRVWDSLVDSARKAKARIQETFC
jgi:hypothetical protein